MRRSSRVLLFVFMCGLAGLFFIRLTWMGFGLGHFDQVVILEGNVVPKKLSCCVCNVNAELRKLAEERADPEMFEYDEAEHITDSRYRVSIKFTFRDGLLYGGSVCYPQHLVVLLELESGQRVFQVVDLPRSQGRNPVFVTLP